MTDPLPLSREGIEEYDHEPAYPLQIEETGQKSDAYVQKVKKHKESVQSMLYSNQKASNRERLFQNKYVLLDEQNNPIENNETHLRKFQTFFQLGPKSYFGGRVLIAQSTVIS